MAGRTVNKHGEPIYLTITNVVAEGGSSYVFDVRLQAPGVSGVAIVNPMTNHPYVSEHIEDRSSNLRLKRVRVGTARPQFVLSRVKLTQKMDVVARREIVAEVDLAARPPRMIDSNAEITLRHA